MKITNFRVDLTHVSAGTKLLLTSTLRLLRRFGVAQSYGIASNLRTDWAAQSGNAAVPGPGAYEVNKGLSNPDVRAFPMHAPCSR